MPVVENLMVTVLFDLGATHSFISTDLVSKIKKPKEELIEMLLMSTPLGRLLLASKEIGDYEIKIGEVNIENDLVILNQIRRDNGNGNYYFIKLFGLDVK